MLAEVLDVGVLLLVHDRLEDLAGALDAVAHHEPVCGEARRGVLLGEDSQALLDRTAGPEVALVVVELFRRAEHSLGLLDARGDLVTDQLDLGEHLVLLHVGEVEPVSGVDLGQLARSVDSLQRAAQAGLGQEVVVGLYVQVDLLDVLVAVLAQKRGQRGQAEVGLGEVPLGGKDQSDLHEAVGVRR